MSDSVIGRCGQSIAAKPAGTLRILADRLCVVIFAMAAWYLLIELIVL